MWRALLLFTLAALRLPADDPAADALVARMVARDRALTLDRAAWSCSVTETREKLDFDKKVLSTTAEKTEIAGNPPSGTAGAPGQNMEASLQQASREEPFNMLQIVSHYNFTLRPDESWNGVPCYKVHFTPKSDQPYGSREERVANGLAGDMWISRSDDTLLHHVGHLTAPVPVAWFFASVHELDFNFNTLQLPNGEWAPAVVQYRFRVALPFFQIHERHTRVYTDYRLTPFSAGTKRG